MLQSSARKANRVSTFSRKFQFSFAIGAPPSNNVSQGLGLAPQDISVVEVDLVIILQFLVVIFAYVPSEPGLPRL